MSDICFVHMPVTQLGHPSMALSVLAAECRGAGIDTSVIYANLRFAKTISLKTYIKFTNYSSYLTMLGELLFKPYAGYPDVDEASDFFAYIKSELEASKQDIQIADMAMDAYNKIQPFINDYLDKLSDAVLATGCIAVGCDITYDQRNAALAIFKRIKEKNPRIITMLGGNSCTGEHGLGLVSYAPQVDCVFSGEADDIIVPITRMLKNGCSLNSINKKFPSLLIKGASIVTHARENLENSALPDFSDYFAELKRNRLDNNIKPCLLIEGSRGCWWGEKKRCTFCGIHTSKEMLQYREKSPQKIANELKTQAKLYGVNAFVFTDCILSFKHVNELPLLLTEKDDFHLFAEVKSNLSKEQLKNLKKAGFVSLQPGIESLQDDLLKLMNKGNRAIKHIEFLKHARACGIRIYWNLLHSIPFEELSYYEQTNKLMPVLTHLQAPIRSAAVIFQKNSVYTQKFVEYGLLLKPLPGYNYVGDFGGNFIELIAEYFLDYSGTLKSNPAIEKELDKISQNVINWRNCFNDGTGDRLTMYFDNDSIKIFDLRSISKTPLHTLSGSSKEIFLAADTVINIKDLRKKFACLPEKDFWEIIDDLESKSLIVRINDEILSLATMQPSLPYIRDPLLPAGKIIIGDELV